LEGESLLLLLQKWVPGQTAVLPVATEAAVAAWSAVEMVVVEVVVVVVVVVWLITTYPCSVPWPVPH
jgi:hypothetical protein